MRVTNDFYAWKKNLWRYVTSSLPRNMHQLICKKHVVGEGFLFYRSRFSTLQQFVGSSFTHALALHTETKTESRIFSFIVTLWHVFFTPGVDPFFFNFHSVDNPPANVRGCFRPVRQVQTVWPDAETERKLVGTS